MRWAWAGAFGFAAQAQVSMTSVRGGTPLIHNTDMAVLEAGDTRKDLPCVVSPDKAFVGFDLRFHAGYDIGVPLRDLAGAENLLTILFRVIPEGRKDYPKYFIQRIRVPSIEEDAKGDAFFQGAFDIGEGRYHVDWLMRDRAERVCAFSWDVEANLPARDRSMPLVIPPNVVEQFKPDQFVEEPPVERSANEPPLHVKVLMNFAPQRATASTLRPLDLSALVSILRTLSREPRIGKFSLVAFNLQDQKIFYRQESGDKIDLPALGKSLSSISLGTVDLKRLQVKHSETQFLTDLIAKEVTPSTHTDAVIFAGPKAMLDANVPDEQLRKVGEVDYPIFYMNYILNPQATPWRDTIGNAVKSLKGIEFTITRPRDLWYAVSDMVGRVVKFRNNKSATAGSGR